MNKLVPMPWTEGCPVVIQSLSFVLVKKQQLELDMKKQTDSKLGREYVQAVYCHPAYLTYTQSTSRETLGWRKQKLESRLPGQISITSDMQMTPP